MYRVIVIVALLFCACEEAPSDETIDCEITSNGMCWINIGCDLKLTRDEKPECPEGFRYPFESEIWCDDTLFPLCSDSTIRVFQDDVVIVEEEETPDTTEWLRTDAPIGGKLSCAEEDIDLVQVICVRPEYIN